jgi:CheY-like chemotaxis protein
MVTSSSPNPQAAKREIVVDDDLSIRLVCTTSLKKAGYQVLETEGSSETMALYTQPMAAIDRLRTDLFLPPPRLSIDLFPKSVPTR